jgi:hypothetical protein
MMMDTFESLCKEWQEFCCVHSLPCMSADELFAEYEDKLNHYQRNWVLRFVDRWERVADEEREGSILTR